MFTKQFASRALATIAAVGLIACGGGDAADPAPANDAPAASEATASAGLNVEAEYMATCGTCHQADGNGMAGAFPPLTGSPIVTADNPARQIAIILKGITGPITIKGQEWNSVMAPWEHLTDEQIAAIATYERTSWGHSASPVTAEQVAEVRASVASRTTSWTIEELEAAVPE